jgi:hypothetical protein
MHFAKMGLLIVEGNTLGLVHGKRPPEMGQISPFRLEASALVTQRCQSVPQAIQGSPLAIVSTVESSPV